MTVSVVITIANYRLPPNFLVSSFSTYPQCRFRSYFWLKNECEAFYLESFFFFLATLRVISCNYKKSNNTHPKIRQYMLPMEEANEI